MKKLLHIIKRVWFALNYKCVGLVGYHTGSKDELLAIPEESLYSFLGIPMRAPAGGVLLGDNDHELVSIAKKDLENVNHEKSRLIYKDSKGNFVSI